MVQAYGLNRQFFKPEYKPHLEENVWPDSKEESKAANLYSKDTPLPVWEAA